MSYWFRYIQLNLICIVFLTIYIVMKQIPRDLQVNLKCINVLIRNQSFKTIPHTCTDGAEFLESWILFNLFPCFNITEVTGDIQPQRSKAWFYSFPLKYDRFIDFKSHSTVYAQKNMGGCDIVTPGRWIANRDFISATLRDTESLWPWRSSKAINVILWRDPSFDLDITESEAKLIFL